MYSVSNTVICALNKYLSLQYSLSKWLLRLGHDFISRELSFETLAHFEHDSQSVALSP
jgi:hypothetical protein